MAKIVKLTFLLLLFCSTLIGATKYLSELKSYDKKIEISSDEELLRVHHALKNIYIKSIINNDIELKKESLKRLVKTSSLLKLNTLGYKNELDTLTKPKTVKIKEKPKILKKQIIKSKVIIEEKKTKSVRYSKYLSNLKGIVDTGYSLKFTFDKKLEKKDIKTFKLKGRYNYREVFDIKAFLPKTYNVNTPKNLEDLRIAQYSAKVLRIVFQRKTNLKSKILITGSNVEIFYDLEKKLSVVKKQNKIYEKYAKSLPPNKVIVIDPGHGGKDAGAVGTKTKYEKRVVLSIALKTGKILQRRGYKVFYTRTKDKFIKLRDRTKYANKKNADLFLSIHANASNKKSLHGIETFFLSPARSKRSKNVAALENKSDIEEMDYFSKQAFLNVFNREKIIAANKLALDVQQGMLNRTRSKYSNIRDGGVREAPFWVLVGAQMTSILIETGYMSNKIERTRMFTSKYQDLLAKGIADGIDSYFLKN